MKTFCTIAIVLYALEKIEKYSLTFKRAKPQVYILTECKFLVCPGDVRWHYPPAGKGSIGRPIVAGGRSTYYVLAFYFFY